MLHFKDKADALRALADLELEIEESPEPRKPQKTVLTTEQIADAEAACQQIIIRHTSITFQTERDRDEARTAYNCGTSIEMMNRHYRDTIDNDETIAEFRSLTPAKIRAAKPKVELPTTRRVEWPPKAKLEKLVWEKPLIHAAADIGVSDVALKKRCVKLGIELPPRGHWLKQK